MSFVLITAILGSFFRGAGDVGQGFNKRYAVTALLFWLSTISLGIRYRPRILFGRDGARSRRVFFISAVIVTGLLPLHLSEIHTWLWLKDRLSETAATVGSGMFDYVRVKRLYYDDGEGYQLMGIFRTQQVYFLPQYPLPAYPLDSRYRVRGRFRPGLEGSPQLLDEYPGRSGYIIIGSMPAGAVATGPLVVTDAENNVVGYGHVSQVPDRWAPFALPNSWFAAFRNPYGSPSVKIYAARGSDAYELARIAVPAKSTGPLPAPSGCLIAGVSDVFLEKLNDVKDPITGTPVVISQPAPVLLKGWAVDRSANLPAPGVKVFLDGNPHDLSYGYPSPDIAGYFKNPAYANIGFKMELPTTGLAKGKHTLFFRVSTRQPPGCRQGGIYLFTLK
ncbi:MAG: hypothetical protein NTW28_27630 [Candidatus Solibacter sp.]|nr:hypothetical protein [Candidatus Solibacter sp.]